MARNNAPEFYPCEHYALDYRKDGSDKFYSVYVSDTGLVVLHWGRRGTVGQNSVTRYRTYSEAQDVALRQVYAKKSKGYRQKSHKKFMAKRTSLEAAEAGRIDLLITDNGLAGAFDGAKATVLKHYEDFYNNVEGLMQRTATEDIGNLLDELQQVEDVWAEIDKRHGEVTAALSVAKATLAQRVFGSALA